MQPQIGGYSLQDSPAHLLRLSLQRMTELFAAQRGDLSERLRRIANVPEPILRGQPAERRAVARPPT